MKIKVVKTASKAQAVQVVRYPNNKRVVLTCAIINYFPSLICKRLIVKYLFLYYLFRIA
jgi:hypothetical protein